MESLIIHKPFIWSIGCPHNYVYQASWSATFVSLKGYFTNCLIFTKNAATFFFEIESIWGLMFHVFQLEISVFPPCICECIAVSSINHHLSLSDCSAFIFKQILCVHTPYLTVVDTAPAFF